MLCIAVAPESRRLGKVDLFNAAGQCDLIEFRLDRLGKEPDLKEMMDGIARPILISCRRKEDGGAWDGTEEERLLQLRTAIIAGPAYVELELDIAEKVPRFGSVKRVVSITDTQRPLKHLEPLVEEAVRAKADVIKFVAPTPTLDAAWPLLAAVAKKRSVPVVGTGLGPQGVMFSLLAQRYGAPWTYAALEQGMEAYPGQVTVAELEATYRWREIGPQTRFVGVAGFGAQTATLRALNAAFAHHQLNIRCLPLELGVSDKIQSMLDALHIGVLVVSPQLCERALNLAEHVDDGARQAQCADLVVKQQDGWHAYNTAWKSVIRVVESALGAKSPEHRPLDRRNVFVIGGGGLARSVALGAQKRKGLLSIAAADDAEARQLAQMTSARFVPLANMYDTLCDVVLIAEAQSSGPLSGGTGGGAGVKLNPAFLREHMHVADLTQLPGESDLLGEARSRGCKVIEPAEIFRDYIATTFKTITGKDL